MSRNDKTPPEGGDDNRSTYPIFPLQHRSLSGWVIINFSTWKTDTVFTPKKKKPYQHLDVAVLLMFGAEASVKYHLSAPTCGGFSPTEGNWVWYLVYEQTTSGASVRPFQTFCPCDLRQNTEVWWMWKEAPVSFPFMCHRRSSRVSHRVSPLGEGVADADAVERKIAGH